MKKLLGIIFYITASSLTFAQAPLSLIDLMYSTDGSTMVKNETFIDGRKRAVIYSQDGDTITATPAIMFTVTEGSLSSLISGKLAQLEISGTKVKLAKKCKILRKSDIQLRYPAVHQLFKEEEEEKRLKEYSDPELYFKRLVAYYDLKWGSR